VLSGAAFLISKKEEVLFDIIYSNVPDKVRRVFTVIIGVFLIGCAASLVLPCIAMCRS